MADRDTRERDILIAANEYAYVQDLTKGDIVLYVGPTKISLSNTERLVEFRLGRFVPVRAEDGMSGVCPFVAATSSQYIILSNPPKDPAVRPVKGSNSAVENLTGRKIVISGPATFPLWPGQMAEVIDGHTLREDQYVVVRVYDAIPGAESPIGTETIAKGSEVSFFIPKTGQEVVPEAGGGYVRNAVTLVDGEYGILLAPNGQRRYARGPGIVFPAPMEEFVQRGGTKIFKATALRRNLGLYVRVVKDFTAGPGDQVAPGSYTAGQELFLKEREGFFFPSENLEIIGEVHAIAVSDKQGIYVRDAETGKIWTEVGPQKYLPDPTRVEVVTRPLDAENAKLYGIAPPEPGRAISIYIPPSFAVLVTAKDRREVVRGPQTRILSYDEDLEVLTLSTGKPKSDETLLRTCFLQTDGNKVSDIVRVRTRDHVELHVTVSYRVSFLARAGSGGDERWFNVKNYVALLCDHLGSLVRAVVRTASVEGFHTHSTEVIRSAILGEKPGEGKRAGRHFEENGMWVYDVEVLDVKILDDEVKKLLASAQRAAIVADLDAKKEEHRLRGEKQQEQVTQEILGARIGTLARQREVEEASRALAEAKGRAVVEVERVEKLGRAETEAQSLTVVSEAEAAAARRRHEADAPALRARVEAFQQQMAALGPDLIATLKVLGNNHFTAEVTRNLAPLAILGGESVSAVLERLLGSLPIGAGAGDGAGPAPAKTPPALPAGRDGKGGRT